MDCRLARSTPPTDLSHTAAMTLPANVALTMADLVALPHLGLSLVAGAGGLDRPVRWAHVCELEDPGPWLEGWELVMTTGMGVPSEPERQRIYIERMAGAQIAGLAISQDLLAPPITDDLRDAADRARFPVVEVSIEVPFVALSRTVAAANTEGAQHRLVTHLGIFDTLRAATAEGVGFAELLHRMEELSGYGLYLCSPTGHRLLDGVAPPPQAVVDHHLPRMRGQPPGIPGGYIVTIPLAHRTVGLLVALDREGVEPAGLTAVQHIATVVALELVNREREREVIRREGAETLAELLSGTLDPPAARKRLALAGLDPDLPVALAAVDLDDGVDDSVVHHGLSDRGVPHLLLAQRELYVLLPHRASGVLGEIAGCSSGIGRGFSIDDGIGSGRREALWALARAKDRAERMARFPEDGDDATWLPTDAASLDALVRRVLGPALEADRRRRTELVRSLRVWLEHDRRTEAAASRLMIHKHTLAYRLKRVEQLTGRSMAKTADLAELWLALRALDVIGTLDRPG
jgi:purine catabolism regulator